MNSLIIRIKMGSKAIRHIKVKIFKGIDHEFGY